MRTIRLREPVSPNEDMTPWFIVAVNALNGEEGVIELNGGNYTLKDALHIPFNVRIKGGKDANKEN